MVVLKQRCGVLVLACSSKYSHKTMAVVVTNNNLVFYFIINALIHPYAFSLIEGHTYPSTHSSKTWETPWSCCQDNTGQRQKDTNTQTPIHTYLQFIVSSDEETAVHNKKISVGNQTFLFFFLLIFMSQWNRKCPSGHLFRNLICPQTGSKLVIEYFYHVHTTG